MGRDLVQRFGTCASASLAASAWFARSARALALALLGLAAASPAAATTLTRTSSFAYDAASGLLTTETIEPGTLNVGTPTLLLQTVYTYDAFGNKIAATVSGGPGGNIITRTSKSTYGA